jgi:hypothetical protein
MATIVGWVRSAIHLTFGSGSWKDHDRNIPTCGGRANESITLWQLHCSITFAGRGSLQKIETEEKERIVLKTPKEDVILGR